MHTRGVDHLAIVADDMPTAMDFYTRVMGFRLVHVRRVPYEQDRGQPPYDNLRHYFFDMGNDSLFPEQFDALIDRVKGCGEKVIGPVPLGGRFWSAYLFDPWGTRLEFATDRSGVKQGVVESVLQTEAEVRAELETLFADPAEIERWLHQMPLRKETVPA